MNIASLIGTVSDIKSGKTKNDKLWMSFSLTWRSGKYDYAVVRCVAFGDICAAIGRAAGTGPVYVSGRLKSDTFKRKDGSEGTSLQFEVREAQPVAGFMVDIRQAEEIAQADAPTTAAAAAGEEPPF